jgi:integrase
MRDTTWHRDGKAKGIYYRLRANGSKSWGFYAEGKINSAPTRQAAIDGKARAGLRKSAGFPAPDTRVRFSDLAQEIRDQKQRKLRPSSFSAFEFALDKVLLPELGHLRPAQIGPDRIAGLVRALERDGLHAINPKQPKRGLAPASIRRYVSPLGPIFKLAVRRGAVPISPVALLSDDERPTGGGVREHYIWSPDEISVLIAAADKLGRRKEARVNYAPLIHLLALTGLRVSEALALRWGDVDLLEAELHVRASLTRSGALSEPKTEAGVRTVPLAPGLVDLLLGLKREDARDDEFVFVSRRGGKPISYFNFRRRGFEPALKAAKLDGKSITIHGLRSAAISLYAARGLTMLETATVMGQKDPGVTWKHYARLFDKSDVAARVRAAQSSIDLGTTIEEAA